MTEDRRNKLSALGKIFYYTGALNSMERVRILHPIGFIAFLIAIPFAIVVACMGDSSVAELLAGFSLKW